MTTPTNVNQLYISKDSKIIIETEHTISKEQTLKLIDSIKAEFKCDDVYVLPKGMKMFVVDIRTNDDE